MTQFTDLSQNPHYGQPVQTSGEPLGRARAAMLMVHGRGARAEDILTLAGPLALPGFTFLAPQAAGNTWYPNRFLEPVEQNEPWLSSALGRLGDLLEQIRRNGVPYERTILLGFSQGACLALEFAARNARRYGGIAGLSGALIGAPDAPRQDSGALAGTPVFLGCSEDDFHVPKERVDQTAILLRKLGGVVTKRLYPGLGHTTNDDEIAAVRAMMQKALAAI